MLIGVAENDEIVVTDDCRVKLARLVIFFPTKQQFKNEEKRLELEVILSRQPLFSRSRAMDNETRVALIECGFTAKKNIYIYKYIRDPHTLNNNNNSNKQKKKKNTIQGFSLLTSRRVLSCCWPRERHHNTHTAKRVGSSFHHHHQK